MKFGIKINNANFKACWLRTRWGIFLLCGLQIIVFTPSHIFAKECPLVFSDILEKIVDKNGQVLNQYKYNEGYVRLSDELMNGEMIKAYRTVRKSLGGLFRDLHWKMFQGRTDDFKKLSEEILDETGHLKGHLINSGFKTHLQLADHFYNENMRKTATNVFVVISNRAEYKKLKWHEFKGSTTEFRRLHSLFRQNTEEGGINKKYVGQKKYIQVADKLFHGDMNTAFINVYAVVADPVQFQTLQWRHFNGSTREFRRLKSHLLDSRGDFKQKWKGQKAYTQFATEFFNGNMTKAFRNVSAFAPSKRVFKKIQWREFLGSVSDFHNLRTELFDPLNGLKPRYIGTIGLKRIAQERFKNNMNRAFAQVTAVLTPREFKTLKWQHFVGKAHQAQTLHSLLLDRKGNIREQYTGQAGYLQFSEDYPYSEGRDMWLVFRHVSTMGLKPAMKKKLNWYRFYGSVRDFRNLQSVLLDSHGKLKPEWKGEEGYLLLAEKYMKGDMKKTFTNVRSVLGGELFSTMKWHQFQGSVSEFWFLKNYLLDEQGLPRPERVGQEAYLQLAEQYPLTVNMGKVFRNASVAMGLKKFKQLDWRIFFGTLNEFRDLKNRLVRKGGLFFKYRGEEGYLKASNELFNGNMNKAYINTTALLIKKEEIAKTRWRWFHGSTEQFMNLRILLLNGNGHVQDKYVGLAGYFQFATAHFKGNLTHAFLYASAVINNRQEMKRIRWQLIDGTVEDLKKLRTRLLDPQGQIKPKWIGEKGRTLLAKSHFGGKLKEVFRKASLVLSREQFLALQWKNK